MRKKCARLLLIPALFLSAEMAEADAYRKIVHPDGRVEYTNKGMPAPSKKSAFTTVYKSEQKDGVIAFSDRRPNSGLVLEVFKMGCYACNPVSKVDWKNTPLNLTAYNNQINNSASRFEVDPALIRAVIHAESHFKSSATSSQGAQGLMQLMPGTAKELGVDDPLDSTENIRGGTQYLAQLLEQFAGNVELATAAYNAGPNAVLKFGGIPPYVETQTYVKRVGILMSRYQEALELRL